MAARKVFRVGLEEAVVNGWILNIHNYISEVGDRPINSETASSGVTPSNRTL